MTGWEDAAGEWAWAREQDARDRDEFDRSVSLADDPADYSADVDAEAGYLEWLAAVDRRDGVR